MEEVVCPKCHSNQVSSNQKGFNSGNAIAGNMIGGAVMGVGMGMIGSNQIVVTCLKCGNQFNAGDGSIKATDDNGNVTIEKQVYVDKNKAQGRTVALVCFVLLIIIFIAITMFFNSLKH